MASGNDPLFGGRNPFAPQAPGGFSPPPSYGGPSGGQPGWQEPNRPKGSNTVWIVLGLVGLLFAGAFVVCCGGVAWLGSVPKPSAAAKQPFDLAAIPIPPLPAMREPLPSPAAGVELFMIPWNDQEGGYYATPGHGGYLYLYLPSGTHVPRSLPCVIIAGAGSTLMHGMDLLIDEDGDMPEHLPYVQAGFAVLAYELDGPDNLDSDDAEARAYKAFRASCAGLVNARNALEYLLAKVPEVNPNQIYAAGHSSAGTAALLFAEHEPRITGVLAYAPCTDVETFQQAGLIRLQSLVMPGLIDFLCQSSPKTHVGRLKQPVFLFHTQDDDMSPFHKSREFVQMLQAQGTEVTFEIAPTGEHYDAMLDEGLPKGIDWLKQRTGKK